MELALNLVWAIITAASYGLLFRRLVIRARGHTGGRSRARCFIALTCFLAILFPVISLTDDLHEMQATAEETSPTVLVIKWCVANHLSTHAQSLDPAVYISAPLPANAYWTVLGVVAAQQIHHSSPDLYMTACDRAPPSFAIPQIS